MSKEPRIAAIRVSSIANDLGARVWNPALRWTVKHAVFVEIETEAGATGLGECWCFDAEPDALIAYLKTEVTPALLGKSATDARTTMKAQWARATLTARHGLLASAQSGVDLALWDLAAQAEGVPLWQAFGGNGTGDCAVYASGGLYAQGKGPTALAKELDGYVQRGFSSVKMKVGGLTPEEDAARVFAARHSIGPDTGLVIDAVSSFDANEAVTFFERVSSARIEAFQAPVPPSNLEGMRRLCLAGVPVMAGEAEYRDEVFAELIEGQAVAILQVAPIACGGASRVLALAQRCAKAGIGMSLETSSTAVATLAALHLAAALPQIDHVEIHQVHDVLFQEANIANPNSNAARMSPPDTPGLGFQLPQEAASAGFEINSSNRKPAPAGAEQKLRTV